MIGPTMTDGLRNFRAQLDRRWPDRDRTSDGWIGDEAHQGRTSGHNPDDTKGSRPAWDGDPDKIPEVRAEDIDTDLHDPDVTMQDVVDHLIRLPGLELVCRYLILDRKIYHERNNFGPVPYTGDPHDKHLHFEGAWSQAGDNNSTFDFKLEEVGRVALTDDDLKRIATVVWGQEVGRTGVSVHNTLFGPMRTDITRTAAATEAIRADIAKLTDPATPDEQVAAAILALLGNRAPAVIALLQSKG